MDILTFPTRPNQSATRPVQPVKSGKQDNQFNTPAQRPTGGPEQQRLDRRATALRNAAHLLERNTTADQKRFSSWVRQIGFSYWPAIGDVLSTGFSESAIERAVRELMQTAYAIENQNAARASKMGMEARSRGMDYDFSLQVLEHRRDALK